MFGAFRTLIHSQLGYQWTKCSEDKTRSNIAVEDNDFLGIFWEIFNII